MWLVSTRNDCCEKFRSLHWIATIRFHQMDIAAASYGECHICTIGFLASENFALLHHKYACVREPNWIDLTDTRSAMTHHNDLMVLPFASPKCHRICICVCLFCVKNTDRWPRMSCVCLQYQLRHSLKSRKKVLRCDNSELVGRTIILAHRFGLGILKIIKWITFCAGLYRVLARTYIHSDIICMNPFQFLIDVKWRIYQQNKHEPGPIFRGTIQTSTVMNAMQTRLNSMSIGQCAPQFKTNKTLIVCNHIQ